MLNFTDSSAIIIAAVIVAFSGISVIMQCIACVIKAGLPKRPLIIGKNNLHGTYADNSCLPV